MSLTTAVSDEEEGEGVGGGGGPGGGPGGGGGSAGGSPFKGGSVLASSENPQGAQQVVRGVAPGGFPSRQSSLQGGGGGTAASFNCTGAVRKAGFLSVKKWLLRKKHQVRTKRSRHEPIVMR